MQLLRLLLLDWVAAASVVRLQFFVALSEWFGVAGRTAKTRSVSSGGRQLDNGPLGEFAAICCFRSWFRWSRRRRRHRGGGTVEDTKSFAVRRPEVGEAATGDNYSRRIRSRVVHCHVARQVN